MLTTQTNTILYVNRPASAIQRAEGIHLAQHKLSPKSVTSISNIPRLSYER